MPLSPEQRARFLVTSREAAHAFVDDMVEIRRVLAAQGQSLSDIRRLSVILRRLLSDRELAMVATPRVGKIHILCPDNYPIYREAEWDPPRFFMSGGAPVWGWASALLVRHFRGAGHIDNIPSDKVSFPPDFNPKRNVPVRLDGFLSQKVLCFFGEWVSRVAVIKYVANFGSAAHSKAAKERDEKILLHLRRDSHVRLGEDGGIHIHLPDVLSDKSENEIDFTPLTQNSIDTVFLELLSAGHFLSISPEVILLENIVKRELNI